MSRLDEVLNIVGKHDSALVVKLRDYVRRREQEKREPQTREDVLQLMLDNSFSHLPVMCSDGYALLRKGTVKHLINIGAVVPEFWTTKEGEETVDLRFAPNPNNRKDEGNKSELMFLLDTEFEKFRERVNELFHPFNRTEPWVWSHKEAV